MYGSWWTSFGGQDFQESYYRYKEFFHDYCVFAICICLADSKIFLFVGAEDDLRKVTDMAYKQVRNSLNSLILWPFYILLPANLIYDIFTCYRLKLICQLENYRVQTTCPQKGAHKVYSVCLSKHAKSVEKAVKESWGSRASHFRGT